MSQQQQNKTLLLDGITPATAVIARKFLAAGSWDVRWLVDRGTVEERLGLAHLRYPYHWNEVQRVVELASEKFEPDAANDVALFVQDHNLDMEDELDAGHLVVPQLRITTGAQMNGMLDADLFQNEAPVAYGRMTTPDCETVSLEIREQYGRHNEQWVHTLQLLKSAGIQLLETEYEISGGVAERVCVPLDIEVWRMFRERTAFPSDIDTLSSCFFENGMGVLSQSRYQGFEHRRLSGDELNVLSWNDSRFRPVYDYFNAEWDVLGIQESVERRPLEGVSASGAAKRILLVGSPHLVQNWRDYLYVASGGKVHCDILEMWDVDSVDEAQLATITRQSEYDVLMELLIGPTHDRHKLIQSFLPMLASSGQVWMHTYNVPATVMAQAVPEEYAAVGFCGVPLKGFGRFVELMKPLNSGSGDMVRARDFARGIGLQVYETADEPGGVCARLMAVLVNSVLFLEREGVVRSIAELDTFIRKALGMTMSPLKIADEIGLDVIEAVLVGVQAFTGEDRYRICPRLTLRIESGQLGKVTGRGFYVG